MLRENTILAFIEQALIKLAQLRTRIVGLFCLVLFNVAISFSNISYAQLVLSDSINSVAESSTANSTTGQTALTNTAKLLQHETELLYDKALRAYLQEDYVAAYSNWRLAAQKKHAKSQFNLALMHERQQVPQGQSSLATALELYKQAANANYPPAYHYWARLLEKDNPDLAQRVRNSIQSNTNAAATKTNTELPVAKTSVLKKHTNKSNAGQSTLPTSVYRRDNWILQQPDERWTVQLLAYRNETKLLDFIDRFALSKESAYFAEYARGIHWYKLIYGVYASKAEAAEARAKLPQTVRNEGPWLRQFKEIKTVIKQSQ